LPREANRHTVGRYDHSAVTLWSLLWSEVSHFWVPRRLSASGYTVSERNGCDQSFEYSLPSLQSTWCPCVESVECMEKARPTKLRVALHTDAGAACASTYESLVDSKQSMC